MADSAGVMQVDVSQGVDDLFSVRVVILPVGAIAHATFEKYSRLVTDNFAHVDVYDMSKLKAGRVHFKFVGADHPAHSDYQEFQAHRKILGVVGIVHCRRSPQLNAAASEFSAALAKYPTALAATCLAFEPLPDQADLERGSVLTLVPNQNESRLLGYLETHLTEIFARALVDKLHACVTDAAAMTYVSTPLDDDANRMRKKNLHGRVAKYKADYSLLASDLDKATELYTHAAELSRQSVDWEWLAGATEGLCAIKVLRRAGDEACPTDEDGDEVASMLADVISSYNKKGPKAALLETEARLKLCRRLIAFGRKEKALEMVRQSYELANANTMSTHNRICIMSSLCSLLSLLSYPRKLAFFLHETAMLHKNAGNIGTAHDLFLQAASAYGVVSLFCPYNDLVALVLEEARSEDERAALRQRIDRTLGSVRADSLAPHRKGFHTVHLTVLEDLIQCCFESGNNYYTAFYIAFLLRKFHHCLSESQQSMYSSHLSRIFQNMHSGHLTTNMLGVPRLTSLAICPLLPNETPILIEKAAEAGGFRFIYSPFGRNTNAKKKPVRWVRGTPARVVVTLSNPLQCALPITNITLRTAGGLFVPIPASVVLEPESTKECVLSGTPMSEGQLSLLGCDVFCLNTQCFHPVDSTGCGISIVDAARQATSALTAASPRWLQVEVIPEMPLLSVALRTMSTSALTLFDGELASMELVLTNTGSLPIGVLSGTLKSIMGELEGAEWADRPVHVPLACDLSALSAGLPLPPGACVVLRLDVHACAGWTSTTFSFKYAQTPDCANQRQHEFRLPVTVAPGLQVRNVDVQTTTCCMEGSEENGTPYASVIVFDVYNPTAVEFALRHCELRRAGTNGRYSLDPCQQAVVLKPEEMKTIIVPFKRFRLSREDIAAFHALETEGKQFVRKGLTDDQEHKRLLARCYHYHLFKRAHIEWHTLSSTRVGALSFDAFALTPRYIRRIMPEALSAVLRYAVPPEEGWRHHALPHSSTPTSPADCIALPPRQFATLHLCVTNFEEVPVTAHVTATGAGASPTCVWAGATSCTLKLSGQEQGVITLSMCCLSAGSFTFPFQMRMEFADSDDSSGPAHIFTQFLHVRCQEASDSMKC